MPTSPTDRVSGQAPQHPHWIVADSSAPKRIRLGAGAMAARDDDDDPRHDDDFDRPRTKKKSGSGALYAMIFLGVLLVGGLIFALIYFLGGSNNLDSEMLAYLPAETNVMGGVEVEELMKNDKVKNLVTTMLQGEGKEFYGKLKEAGMTENDFSRILVGAYADLKPKVWVNGKPPPKDEQKMAVVIRAKKSFDKAKIAQVANLSEQSKNGKTYYKSNKDKELFVYYPTDTLAVIVPSEKGIESIFSRDAGKAVVSEDMQDLAKKMSKGHLWFAMSSSMFGDDLKKVKDVKDVPFAPSDVINAFSGMKGMGAYAKVDGDKVTFGAGVLCQDSSTASKAADALQKEIEKMRDQNLEENPIFKDAFKGAPSEFKTMIKDIQKSAKADSSGAMLEMFASFSLGGLEAIFKGAMGGVQRDTIQRPPEAHDMEPFPPNDFNKDLGPPRKDFGPPRDFGKFPQPPKDLKFPPFKDAPTFPKDFPKRPDIKDFPAPPKDFPKVIDPKDLIPPIPKDFPKLPDFPKDFGKPDFKDAPKLPGQGPGPK